MKVAYVLSSVCNSGPFIVTKNIIDAIYNKVASPIDIYYLKTSDEKLEFKSNCIKISFLNQIDFSKYDIVHTHGFLADMYMYLHRRNFQAKWICTIHQDIKPDYSMLYNTFIATMLEKVWCHGINRADCVVGLTKEMVKYYSNKLTKTSLTYIHNGLTPNIEDSPISIFDATRLLSLKKEHLLLGVSANLISRKGIDQIINYLATYKIRKIALVIIGEGTERKKLETLASKYHVQNQCLFFGYRANSINYFNYFDLYIMSSRSEAFGLCVLEAASQKIPVVCSDLPVFRELFSDEEVVRFKIDDVHSLSKAIESAIERKEELSQKIKDAYFNKYTSQIMGENYLSLYEERLAFTY